MTDIRFLCPACGGKLVIAPRLAVKEVPCPLCKERIIPWGAETLDVRFKCPSCDAKLVVDRTAEGSAISCPKCDHEVLVPSQIRMSSSTPAPTPAPSSAPEEPMAPPPPPPMNLPTPGPTVSGKDRTGTLSTEEVDFLTAAEPRKAAPAPAPAPAPE